ncbi:MAG TPA: phosphotransferase [Luteibacter sp.]|nr:phosphotransferase [Luteibacter sp.]
MPMPSNDERSAARLDWARAATGNRALDLAPASADASFRSYWRGQDGERSVIVMDSPPALENPRPWLEIGARLDKAGLHVPAVYAADPGIGFLLIEDLGQRTYLGELDDRSVDALYADALDALLRMQTHADAAGLPHFDTAWQTMELELMPTWLLEKHLGRTLECGDWDVIEVAFRVILDSLAAQPRAFMHRDYHSRNLMIVDRHNPGVIDFQGAMTGPVTYDLASVLRDCYIVWDNERVEGWVESYRMRLRHAHLIGEEVDTDRFQRWFDMAGLQRHIKVLGLFCRLCYRDGKPAYLDDLPRVLSYVTSVARRHHELVDFADLLERMVGERDLRVPA